MNSMMIVVSKWIFILFVIGACWSYKTRIPIGIILHSQDDIPATILRYALWLQTKEVDWPKEYFLEVAKETVTPGDATQLDRAVCRLLKQGIYALVTPPSDPFAYKVIAGYSNEFEIPLISPSIPEVPQDQISRYGISVQPSTTRAVLDLLRYENWQDIVYVYDSDDGPEKLQTIYQLGYRVLKMNLQGIMRISHPLEATRYLRKLENTKTHRSFHIILDTDPLTAREIIIRHVHDVHVGKANFHFIITQQTLQDYWSHDAVGEFAAVNVTGFLALSNEKARILEGKWLQLSPNTWEGAGKANLNVSSYFYYDGTLALVEGLKKMLKGRLRRPDVEGQQLESRDCLQFPAVPLTSGRSLAQYIKQNIVKDGISGKLQFNSVGMRNAYEIQIMRSSRNDPKLIGSWSDSYGLKIFGNRESSLPTALAMRDEKKHYRITSLLSPPFLMYSNSDGNGTQKTGNDRFEGYCKDMMDLLSKEMGFDYVINLVKERVYGKYDEVKGEWTGAIGQIIRGKADMVIADLHITGHRQRVVDFAEPFSAASLSILMKNPLTVNLKSSFFFLNAFTPGVWICIVISAVIVTILFHIMVTFTGSPDTIEAASGIWGKKFTVIGSIWFTIGSALMQATGVYPRSIPCRVLGGTWWCVVLLILSLYISSLTTQLYINTIYNDQSPQLKRLNDMSLESIIKESVTNSWPRIGVVEDSAVLKFIQKSSIPVYMDYHYYLGFHTELMVETVVDGMQRVRKSNGDYAFLMDSLASDFLSRQKPCDTVSIHDTVAYTTYGIAVPLSSSLRSELNEALRSLSNKGELGNLHRKWFVEKSSCKSRNHLSKEGEYSGTLVTVAGLFYVLLIGLAIVGAVGVIQYFWRARKKEERRQKLSFEELAAAQSLPLPPPELLLEQTSAEPSKASTHQIPASWTNVESDSTENKTYI